MTQLDNNKGKLIGKTLSDAANSPILQRANWIEAVDTALREQLPEAMWVHARLANVKDGKLVYLVSSPIWKAKLRLNKEVLLKAARAIGLQADDLVVGTATLELRPDMPEAGGLRLTTVGKCGLKEALALLQPESEK